jgi:hypothetical protein
MKCFKCSQEIIMDRKVFRQDTCPRCGSYLRTCLNCRFYDKVAYHECRESQADLVRDKEIANFCDYFEPRKVQEQADDKTISARDKLNRLFKKPGADS